MKGGYQTDVNQLLMVITTTILVVVMTTRVEKHEVADLDTRKIAVKTRKMKSSVPIFHWFVYAATQVI